MRFHLAISIFFAFSFLHWFSFRYTPLLPLFSFRISGFDYFSHYFISLMTLFSSFSLHLYFHFQADTISFVHFIISRMMMFLLQPPFEFHWSFRRRYSFDAVSFLFYSPFHFILITFFHLLRLSFQISASFIYFRFHRLPQHFHAIEFTLFRHLLFDIFFLSPLLSE